MADTEVTPVPTVKPALPKGSALTLEDIQARSAAARKAAPVAVNPSGDWKAALAGFRAELDTLTDRVETLELAKK